MNALIQKRNPKRRPVRLRAQMDSAAGRQEIRIRDVSAAGALVEAETTPAEGEEVSIMCGDLSWQARTAWCDSSIFGIEFNVPLEATFVADELGNKLRVSTPRSYRHDVIDEAEERPDDDFRKITMRNPGE